MKQKSKRWGKRQWRHLETSLCAQLHRPVKKHRTGPEEVPVPACHQPALWSWTNHMVSLGLLQMRGLDWTPKVPSTITDILRMSLWGERGWQHIPQIVQEIDFWHIFLLMILITTLFSRRWTCKYNSLSPASLGQNQTCNCIIHLNHTQKEPEAYNQILPRTHT